MASKIPIINVKYSTKIVETCHVNLIVPDEYRFLKTDEDRKVFLQKFADSKRAFVLANKNDLAIESIDCVADIQTAVIDCSISFEEEYENFSVLED